MPLLKIENTFKHLYKKLVIYAFALQKVQLGLVPEQIENTGGTGTAKQVNIVCEAACQVLIVQE